MNCGLKNANIGPEIAKRLDAIGMSKSEFGRRIGVQQQHVNRLLGRDTIDLRRLYRICEVLDFNFFALFCELPRSINASYSAISEKGDAQYIFGNDGLVAQLELQKKELEMINSSKDEHKDRIEQYKSQLQDKEEIIALLKEQVANLKQKE